jgi:hypothetical protein
MTLEKVQSLLSQHVPASAIAYCAELWRQNPFHLIITKSRKSKAGDFFCASFSSTPRISVNNDLNPYLFLVTYIHEVAHLHIFRNYSRRVDPHGDEWKNVFKQLLQPVLVQDIFPEPLFTALNHHMKNPMASSFADARLTQAFRKFDAHHEHMITVHDLPEGSLFLLHGRHFKKGKLKRTRFLCQEIKSKRQYLVPAEALVENAQLGFEFGR